MKYFLFLILVTTARADNTAVYMLNSPTVLYARHTTVGTGFNVVAPDGVVVGVTAGHVCEDAENGVLVADFNNKPWGYYHVLGMDPKNDLCIIEGVDGHRPIELSTDSFPNQIIHVVGYPLGGPQKTTYGMTQAPLLATARRAGAHPFICGGEGSKLSILADGVKQNYLCTHDINVIGSSVPIRGGNSGGPVLNENDKVVGVVDVENHLHQCFFVPVANLWLLLSKF